MDVTNPYEFIGFGAMDVTKPYEFIGFGAMDVLRRVPCRPPNIDDLRPGGAMGPELTGPAVRTSLDRHLLPSHGPMETQ